MKPLNKTVKQIRRSPYQALAAIAVLTVTFFVANVFALVALGSQAILRHFETRPQVIAYLKEDVTEAEVTPLEERIESLDTVKEARFISKQEAFEIYKESVGNDPLLLGTVTELAAVTAEILPASLEITATDPKYFPEIVSALSDSELVDTNSRGEKDIDFPQDVISELTAWTNGIRLGGIVLISALAVSSVLTIMIIISMKVGQRRTEIGTIKLLGAKNSFISIPYLLESNFYSMVGSFFGWILALISILYATPFLAPRLSGIIALPPDLVTMAEILAGSLLAAVLLGTLSGSLAVGRFLRRR